jgi:hypothetical protein
MEVFYVEFASLAGTRKDVGQLVQLIWLDQLSSTLPTMTRIRERSSIQSFTVW